MNTQGTKSYRIVMYLLGTFLTLVSNLALTDLYSDMSVFKVLGYIITHVTLCYGILIIIEAVVPGWISKKLYGWLIVRRQKNSV